MNKVKQLLIILNLNILSIHSTETITIDSKQNINRIQYEKIKDEFHYYMKIIEKYSNENNFDKLTMFQKIITDCYIKIIEYEYKKYIENIENYSKNNKVISEIINKFLNEINNLTRNDKDEDKIRKMNSKFNEICINKDEYIKKYKTENILLKFNYIFDNIENIKMNEIFEALIHFKVFLDLNIFKSVKLINIIKEKIEIFTLIEKSFFIEENIKELEREIESCNNYINFFYTNDKVFELDEKKKIINKVDTRRILIFKKENEYEALKKNNEIINEKKNKLLSQINEIQKELY